MNNNYEQLRLKTYTCEKCNYAALVFDECDLLICPDCGEKLIEVKYKEKENEQYK